MYARIESYSRGELSLAPVAITLRLLGRAEPDVAVRLELGRLYGRAAFGFDVGHSHPPETG